MTLYLKTKKLYKKSKTVQITYLTSFYFYFLFPYSYCLIRASLIAQLVKNLPAMQETPVQFLGWEDPVEKG